MDNSILIVGSGAVATLFAARLAASGTDVQMLAGWQDAIEAVSQQGVRLVLPDGGQVQGAVRISSDPAAFAEARHVILLVKSWQTQRAADQIKGILTPDGIVLTLQNGLGNREILADVLGSDRSAAGVIVLGAQTLQPGVVKTTGPGLVQLENNQKLDFIQDALVKAGFRVDIYDDILTPQWEKLVVNAAVNPLSAVLGVPNGNLLHKPHPFNLLAKLTQEAAMIADAAGVQLQENQLAKIKNVIEKTSDNQSSMLQDLLRGAPTEIDAINGRLLEYAQALGVDAPFNQCLFSLIKAMTGSKTSEEHS